VIGVYDQLEKKFDKYLAYLENLRERIAISKTQAKRTEARDKARKNYDVMAGKECFFAFFDNNVHPQAREAERAYLRSSDKLFEYYLSEFVLNSQGEAVRGMKDFTNTSKENLTRWVRLLATGRHTGDPIKHYNGLYDFDWAIVRKGMNGLQAEIKMGNPYFETNKVLAGVQQMLDVQAADTHYQSNNRVAEYAKVKPQIIPYTMQPEIQDGLDTFVWKVNLQEGGQTLDFELGMMDENQQINQFNKAETESATSENFNVFSKILYKHFQVNLQGTPIVTLLSNEYPTTTQLAADLKQLAHPLYQSPTGGGAPYYSNHMFMRLDANTNPAFFNNLENDIQRNLAGTREAINPLNTMDHVTSQDPHKFTFLQFHYMIPSKSFPLMDSLRTLFQQTMAKTDLTFDPVTNYVFNAEKEAHQFALKRAQFSQMNFNSFKPEIVTLLEQPEKVKLFFLAYAQGLLVFQDGKGLGNTTWTLNMGDGYNPVILYDENEINRKPQEKCTVYEALYFWNVGRDCRPLYNQSNLINWKKLSDIIRGNEDGVGQDQVLNNYLAHIEDENPESIVSLLNKQIKLRSSFDVLTNIAAAGKVNIDQTDIFNDLIDLAKLIYQERVEIYRSADGWRA